MKPFYTILMYTDGALKELSGGPGRCGMAAIILSQKSGDITLIKECSWYEDLEVATNTYAELCAIRNGIEQIDKNIRDTANLTIFTDSMWCIHKIRGEQKPTVYQDIVLQIRKMLGYFNSAELLWVRGHSRNPYNDRVDTLARAQTNKKQG